MKRERTIAEMIIEEFMLAANETVAEHFHWLNVPFLYRIHEDPDSEKLLHFMAFRDATSAMWCKGKGNKVHPRALQIASRGNQGQKEETVISTVMLRSMKQAKYDAESLGTSGWPRSSIRTSPRRSGGIRTWSFIGLSAKCLTSGGALPESAHDDLAARMPDIARQSSERERRGGGGGAGDGRPEESRVHAG